MNNKIAIQGYSGSFHEEAATRYFGEDIVTVPCDSFEDLCSILVDGKVDFAVMAIENSIAGSILQNYRLLREHNLWIFGEIYLEIKHQLCVNPGTDLSQIKKVHSHPMALNQCLDFLQKMPNVKLISTEDTALSAWQLAEKPNLQHACIASERAATLAGLEIIGKDIHTHSNNYTRFFMLKRQRDDSNNSNKASIYLTIPDQRGMLLKVLQLIDQNDLNMSKLQSFPVLGAFRSYFFHIDVEYQDVRQYTDLLSELISHNIDVERLGEYLRADQAILSRT